VGVLGAEHARSGDWPGPAHDVTLAFTRNAIGAMDYTPVAFSASGSEAHALAQAIVFESGLQHYADAPERYAERPAALELLEAVPAAWDETRLLRGAPDRSVTLARRSAGEWFVGSLHAGGPRTARARLDFLRPGRQYEATVTADGPAGLEVTRRTVTVQSTLTLPVARDGGFAVRLEPR
jgi:hypothetical protein